MAKKLSVEQEAAQSHQYGTVPPLFGLLHKPGLVLCWHKLTGSGTRLYLCTALYCTTQAYGFIQASTKNTALRVVCTIQAVQNYRSAISLAAALSRMLTSFIQFQTTVLCGDMQPSLVSCVPPTSSTSMSHLFSALLQHAAHAEIYEEKQPRRLALGKADSATAQL